MATGRVVGGMAGLLGGGQRSTLPTQSQNPGTGITSTGGADTNITGRRRVQNSDGTWSEDIDYGIGLDKELETRDRYNAQAEARRQASLRALMESSGGTGTGAGGGGTVAFDEQGARDAAFARAKDKAGSIARSSVDSLRELLGNNLGGAKEAAGLAGVAGGAANELGEFNRAQLMLDLNRAGEISDRERSAGLEQQRINNAQKQSLYALFSEGKGPIY